MRSFGFRLSFLAAILWAGIGSTVWALGNHGEPIETVYVMPMATTLTVPTSYVVSTSWAEPTAYAVPTYYTTAYWMDPLVLAQPSYATTSYVRRGLFGRRWLVERPVLATYATTYVPSAYYVPSGYRTTSYAIADRMVVPSAYIASADCVCPPGTALASAAPTYAMPPRASSAPASGSSSRPRTLRSQPDDRSSMPSDVEQPAEDLNAVGNAGATARQTIPNTSQDRSGAVRDNSPTPPPARPATPAGRPQTSTTPGQTSPRTGQQGGQTSSPATTTTPGAAGAGQAGGATVNPKPADTPGAGATTPNAGTVPVPTAPADPDANVPPAIGPPGEYRRESMRPSTYAARPVRSEIRNVLIGTVLSRSAGEPEEGVRIEVMNTTTGGSKASTTDAFGRFAIRLADGDWSVNVNMPSGRVYEVSQIRVGGGQIIDGQGRRVPSLEITR